MLSIAERDSIRNSTGWSDIILDAISSVEEARIYIRAGLKEKRVGGRAALVRTDINWSDFSVRRNIWLKNKLTDYDKWAVQKDFQIC